MIALLKREMIILLMFIFYFAALWLKNKDKKIKIGKITGIVVTVIAADVLMEWIAYLFNKNTNLFVYSIVNWILTNFVFVMAAIGIYGISVQTEKSIRELCREISISVKTGVLCMLLLGILFVILDYQYATAMLAEMQEALGNGDIMRLMAVNMESRYSLFLGILRILIPGCIMGSFVIKIYRNSNE